MSHKVFIRHTYIYKCGDKQCGGEWKINPHCGKYDYIEYVEKDQRVKYQKKWG